MGLDHICITIVNLDCAYKIEQHLESYTVRRGVKTQRSNRKYHFHAFSFSLEHFCRREREDLGLTTAYLKNHGGVPTDRTSRYAVLLEQTVID